MWKQTGTQTKKAPQCLNWPGNDPKQLKTLFNNEKSPKAIITDPLRKDINRERVGKKGVGHERVNNQRDIEKERETKSKLPEEEGRQLYSKH